MKTTSAAAAFVLVLALAPVLARPAPVEPPAPLAPRAPVGGGGDRRGAAIRALPRGATFAARGRQYQVVGARAVPRTARESEAEALARAGAAASDVLERKGTLLVVRSAAAPSAAAAAQGEPLPVVVNVRTGRLGVVMGLLNVKLRPGADAAAIARAHGLTVESQAPRLGLAFLRVPAGQDVAAAAAAVAADPGVASAEPDVLEHVAKVH